MTISETGEAALLTVAPSTEHPPKPAARRPCDVSPVRGEEVNPERPEAIVRDSREWGRRRGQKPPRVFLALVACLALSAFPAEARIIERPHIRVIDGDTVEVNGVPMRLPDVDAPETQRRARGGAQCEAEIGDGLRARDSLREALRGAEARVTVLGRLCGWSRPCALVETLREGSWVDVREIGLSEGWLRPWDYEGGQAKPDWCAE